MIGSDGHTPQKYDVTPETMELEVGGGETSAGPPGCVLHSDIMICCVALAFTIADQIRGGGGPEVMGVFMNRFGPLLAFAKREDLKTIATSFHRQGLLINLRTVFHSWSCTCI